MKKQTLLLSLLGVTMLMTACNGTPNTPELKAEIIYMEETDTDLMENPSTVLEKTSLFSTSAILEYGTGSIEDKDKIPSMLDNALDIGTLTFSFYGSDALTLPFTVNDILNSTKTPLKSYYYNDGTGTYSVIYPADSTPTVDMQLVLYYDTDQTTGLDELPADGLILSGLHTLKDGVFVLNGMDFTTKALETLNDVSSGHCSGFSSKVYNDDISDCYDYRIIRYGDSSAKYNIDAFVTVAADGNYLDSIMIQ